MPWENAGGALEAFYRQAIAFRRRYAALRRGGFRTVCAQRGGGGNGGRRCTCSSINRRRYLARLSGPLLDRMDIRIDVHTPSRADMSATIVQTSDTIRQRVSEARARTRRRLAGTPWTLNVQLPGSWLRHHSGIETSLINELDRLVESGHSSMRGVDRMLRLAWTLADLEGAPRPTFDHIVAAQQLRNGADHYE